MLLTAVEELLRPKHLIDQVRGVVLGSARGSIDLDEIDGIQSENVEGAVAHMNATVEKPGGDVATDGYVFRALLLSLVRGGSRVWLFDKATQHEGLAVTSS